MLKVLIIDDEKLVRAMVRQCIDWEAIGLQVVGEASSARMGMEMLEELHTDMIIMDIKMPGMNGLACSQFVLDKYPWMKIIILSGHDDFEYASEGIHIGVVEYLLKPVNDEELRKAVIKAKQAIMVERDHQKEFERYKEELGKHAVYIKDRQLFGAISSSSPQQYLETLEYFGIKINGKIFQVALIEPQMPPGSPEEEKILMKMLIRKLTEDYYGNIPGIYISDSGAEWSVILNNSEEDILYDSAPKLCQYLEDNTEIRICMNIGNVYYNVNKVRESYREAKDASAYRFSSGENIICFRDVYPYYDANVNMNDKEGCIRELGNDIRIGDSAAAEQKLSVLLEKFRQAGGEREQALILTIEVFAEIMKVLTELKIAAHSNAMNYSSVISEVFLKDTFEEIEEYLRKIILEACASIRAEVSDKEKSLVRKVRDELDEHYADEELSLNTLAKKYYVNPSYLSRVFKEKTGATFTGYLFAVRMKEAEYLVLHSEMKAYEIAEQVGIADPHYFSSCFKKHTGMSVAEFKKTYVNVNTTKK